MYRFKRRLRRNNLLLILLSLGMVACSNDMASENTVPKVGQQVWEQNCKVCHQAGLAGAPIIGNKAQWEKRLSRGLESLYGHALSGWGDMPAKGGNPELTEAEVKQAVDYMVSAVKQ